ncbi:hypothetical protein HJ588_05695 [Flexivirga sp. ID2601S]|uniref:Uncharacterized protein n=1 Tax=Flexivirga aerilata TaxID=1656889 RepID=A0A849AGT0_9MICO|nr:hypothetical protein [Flexivirga aerilata]NNG38766.1 hypothetical protein [Flexivirga aerilata]
MALAIDRSTDRRLIFSQGTAAAIWGLPRIGERTELVEYATPPGLRGRSPQARRRRNTQPPVTTDLGGLQVTTVEQTIIDHARYAGLESAVAMCDAALHLQLTQRSQLMAFAKALPAGSRGCRMAELATFLADGASESPLESLSRIRMFQLDLPMPQLQVEFTDALGLIGRTDFYWDELGIVGEADGAGKYAVPEGHTGEAAARVLRAEKSREDRLRRHPKVQAVIRWGWDDALPVQRFHDLMSAAGIRPGASDGWPIPDGPLPRKSKHVTVIERHRT